MVHPLMPDLHVATPHAIAVLVHHCQHRLHTASVHMQSLQPPAVLPPHLKCVCSGITSCSCFTSGFIAMPVAHTQAPKAISLSDPDLLTTLT